MKKFIPLLAIVLFTITGCETKTKTSETPTQGPSNQEAVEKEVTVLMDNMHNALKSKKADDFRELLDADGLYCGTDPTEVLDRENFSANMAETLNNPETGDIAYTIDTREILVDDSGVTATVLEQYKMDLSSPEIPWRLVSHAVKKDGSWKIDFLSFSLVPTNKQQQHITTSVSEGA